MEIIILPRTSGRGPRVCLGPWAVRVLAGAAVVLAAALVWLGMRLAPGPVAPVADTDLGAVAVALEQERGELSELRRTVTRNLDALALQLGTMEARLIRLDAVGERLATMADLDPREFGFGVPAPPVGGPSPDTALESYTANEFLGLLDRTALRISEREQTLGALEAIIRTLHLQQEVRPTGRPVIDGWISSFYGHRVDPLSGKKAFHGGVDFAGRRGSDVVAVAAGVVTWSGRRRGYGHLVEITHGNGLVTRYAHNQRNLVAVGDAVKKGDVIALMGSSGRATGPHVHFEVLLNGRSVNPIQYVRAEP